MAENLAVDDFYKTDKIDAHVHVFSRSEAFIEQAQQDRYRLLAINAEFPGHPPVLEQEEIALLHQTNHPEWSAYVCTFTMNGWGDDDWVQRTIDQLDSSFKKGACAVKIWKNIGMDVIDQDGRLIMVDDPELSPIFDFLSKNGYTVIGHLGEPKNCWLPLERMTVKNDREYFAAHPQYHMYLHKDKPSYEHQIRARDRMLEKNETLRFVGAHLASLEWSVDRVAAFLDRFPNAAVDLAERITQLQYQSQKNLDKVRDFFVKYQDRILYGSDIIQNPEDNDEAFKHRVHQIWRKEWLYLATDERIFVPEIDAKVEGLALPKEVVLKVYQKNALRVFPGAWHGS